MTTLYSVVDPVVASVLAVSKDGVNAELAAFWSGDEDDPESQPPIRGTAGFPVTPQQISDGKLPLLSCYRRTQVDHETSALYSEDKQVTLQFMYIGPDTNPDHLGSRWPLLNAVWEAILSAVQCTREEYVGATPSDAGVITFVRGSAKKTEQYLRTGSASVPGTLYPAFVGEFDIIVREPTDISGLQDWVDMFGKIYVDGWAEEPADVEFIATNPDSAAANAVEPFDPETN
jgi:hypothetical protein